MGHDDFMRVALACAQEALALGEVPIGAVVVHGGEVIGRGFNHPIGRVDPTAHAEIVALRDAAQRLGNYRLPGCAVYATVEPCLMCVGALLSARVDTVVFGALEPKFGALRSILRVEDVPAHHRFEIVAGVLEAECRQLMTEFFQSRRSSRPSGP